MKIKGYCVKVGIVGCGAIGSRMAETIGRNFKEDCRVRGLYDVDYLKAARLAQKLNLKGVVSRTLPKLVQKCDCIVEATNARSTFDIVKQALTHRKSILTMSVGKLLKYPELFRLARKMKCHILLPSGAIAGVDAIKAASLKHIKKITLTTRKPPSGFVDNAYLLRKRIDLNKITKQTVLFSGDVATAVKYFPQNINVAATIALACQNIRARKKIRIKIMTSPRFKRNSHQIEMEGDFGRMVTKTDNVVCPDNPKSSYLAVLSGLQTLKQYCTGILIGT